MRAVEKMGGLTTIFLVLGAIFTLLGALFTARDQAKDAKKLEEKSDEITRLTKANADLVTGGDSYCFLRFVPSGKGGYLNAEQRGDFPVYDVSAQVVDLSDGHLLHDPSNPAEIIGKVFRYNIGNLVVDAVPFTIGTLLLPEKGNLHYNVIIQARNGIAMEDISGSRLKNGKWEIKIQVSRFDSATKTNVILETDSSSFPI